MTIKTVAGHFSGKRKGALYASSAAGLFLACNAPAQASSQPVCTVTTGSNYVCEGSTTEQQSINDDNATVTTLNSLSIDTTDDSGISIKGYGELAFNDSLDQGSQITGRIWGIYMRARGDIVDSSKSAAGEISFASGGTIRGYTAVTLENDGSGATNITVDGSIEGSRIGIDSTAASDAAAHSVTVNSNGWVKGTDENATGLTLTNNGAGVIEITVNQGGYVGGREGITASAYGGGKVSIDIFGKVEGIQYKEGYPSTAIRIISGAGDVVVGGELWGTEKALFFVEDTAHRLELRPGYSIVGEVDASLGTGSLFLGGEKGRGSFNIGKLDWDNDLSDNQSSQYHGFTEFTKIGQSTWNLYGENSDAPAMTIDEGTVELGYLAKMAFPKDIETLGGGITAMQFDRRRYDFETNAAFTINDGGTLTGSGRFSQLQVNSGGILSPGIYYDSDGDMFSAVPQDAEPLDNSMFGQMTVDSATFEEGSIFAVDITPEQLLSDTLYFTDSVTINGGTVHISGPEAVYSDDLEWTIIARDDEAIGLNAVDGKRSGITGRFTAVTDNIPDYDFIAIYGADTVKLGFEQTQSDDVSDKSNGGASNSGIGFGSMNFSQSLADFSLNSAGNVGGGQVALRNLLGPKKRAFNSFAAMAGDDSGWTDQLVNSGIELSVIGVGNWTEVDYGNGNGYDSDTYGGAVVLGYRSFSADSGFHIGVGGGYTSSDVDTRSGKGDVETKHVGLYASYRTGALTASGAFSYGWVDADLSRQPLAGVTASANADGKVYSGSLEVSYDVLRGQSRPDLSASPFVRLRGFHSKIDGYSESGAGLLNLTVDDMNAEALFGSIGIRLAQTFGWQDGGSYLRPYISVAFEHQFLDADAVSIASLTSLPGSSFSTPVGVGREELFNVGAGVESRIGEALYMQLDFKGAFGDVLEERQASLGLKYRF